MCVCVTHVHIHIYIHMIHTCIHTHTHIDIQAPFRSMHIHRKGSVVHMVTEAEKPPTCCLPAETRRWCKAVWSESLRTSRSGR